MIFNIGLFSIALKSTLDTSNIIYALLLIINIQFIVGYPYLAVIEDLARILHEGFGFRVNIAQQVVRSAAEA